MQILGQLPPFLFLGLHDRLQYLALGFRAKIINPFEQIEQTFDKDHPCQQKNGDQDLKDPVNKIDLRLHLLVIEGNKVQNPSDGNQQECCGDKDPTDIILGMPGKSERNESSNKLKYNGYD